MSTAGVKASLTQLQLPHAGRQGVLQSAQASFILSMVPGWEFSQEVHTDQSEAENVDGASHLSLQGKKGSADMHHRQWEGMDRNGLSFLQVYIRQEEAVSLVLSLTHTRRAPQGRNWLVTGTPC